MHHLQPPTRNLGGAVSADYYQVVLCTGETPGYAVEVRGWTTHAAAQAWACQTLAKTLREAQALAEIDHLPTAWWDDCEESEVVTDFLVQAMRAHDHEVLAETVTRLHSAPRTMPGPFGKAHLEAL